LAQERLRKYSVYEIKIERRLAPTIITFAILQNIQTQVANGIGGHGKMIHGDRRMTSSRKRSMLESTLSLGNSVSEWKTESTVGAVILKSLLKKTKHKTTLASLNITDAIQSASRQI